MHYRMTIFNRAGHTQIPKFDRLCYRPTKSPASHGVSRISMANAVSCPRAVTAYIFRVRNLGCCFGGEGR